MSQSVAFTGRSAVSIAASIEEALQSGKLPDGKRLPPIRELARSLPVSPVTVTAAYRLLGSRGLALGSGRLGTALCAQVHLAPTPAGASRHAAGLVDLAT